MPSPLFYPFWLCLHRSCHHHPHRPSPLPASCLGPAWPPAPLPKHCWEVSARRAGKGAGGHMRRAELSCQALPGCRQDGTGSGQSSPDLPATRLRPVSPITVMLCPPQTCPQPSCNGGRCHPCALGGSGGRVSDLNVSAQHLLSSPHSSAHPLHHPAELPSPTPSCTSADPVGAPVPPHSPKSFTQANHHPRGLLSQQQGLVLPRAPSWSLQGLHPAQRCLHSYRARGILAAPLSGCSAPWLCPISPSLLPGIARAPPVQPWFPRGLSPRALPAPRASPHGQVGAVPQ